MNNTCCTFHQRLNYLTVMYPCNNKSYMNVMMRCMYAGHFGYAKTLARIQRQFHWQNIHDDVATYCNTCVSCRRNKPSNRKPAGLLNPFPTPLIPWWIISLDFITHLPRTDDGYDCIMVVIDKFSKRAHFIPTTSDATTHSTA